jgi:hypothetical protein
MGQCPSTDADSRSGRLAWRGLSYQADNCHTETNASYAYDPGCFHFLSFDPVEQVAGGVCRQFASVQSSNGFLQVLFSIPLQTDHCVRWRISAKPMLLQVVIPMMFRIGLFESAG